jgi:2',3'-cyclic-nucleotide 2'-phosphodiesterase (5'-nucleotidase family)
MDREHDCLGRWGRRLVSIALGLATACGAAPPPPAIVPAQAVEIVPRLRSTPRLVIGLLANANGGFDSTLHPDGGGLAALAAQLRDDGLTDPDALLLDNGDLWTHAPVVRLTGPWPLLQTYDRLGFAAINLGHHDYEPGRARLRAWSEALRLRFLGANVEDVSGRPAGFVEPQLQTRRSGVKICTIGLNHVDTARRTRAESVAGLRFTPYRSTLIRELERAWRGGCELTVALVHDETAVVETLVASLPPSLPLDLAVAANDSGFIVRRVGGTVVVHPGAYGREYALVEVRPGAKRPWRFDVRARRVGSTAPDRPNPTPLIPWETAASAAAARLAEIIGELPDLLAPGSFGESALGHFVCDAWLERFEDADVALLNFGALRAALPAGPVTEGDLRSALPFDDELVRVDVTARELARLLAHGSPVVGGLTWSFRERDGRRMVETLLGPRGRRLQPDDRLRLITVDFIAGGGDGFPFASLEAEPTRTGVDWRDPVRRRFEAVSRRLGSRVEPRARRLRWSGAEGG